MAAPVDIVRRIYAEGMIDGDPERVLALADESVEFVNPADAVEPGVRHGRGLIRAAEAAREPFASSRHELRALFDGGDCVVAAVTFRARGQGSGVDVAHEEAHTWTFRGGRIVRFEWGRDVEAALAAAGIQRSSAVPVEHVPPR